MFESIGGQYGRSEGGTAEKVRAFLCAACRSFIDL
jgi:hypothetical protein